MRSAFPPERLVVELQSVVGPTLAEKGYRLVGSGPAGLLWRRTVSRKLLAGLVALGLFALGGCASGEPGSIALGLIAAGVAVALLYLRRPAVVTIDLATAPGGTDVRVSGGPGAGRAAALAAAVAGRAEARSVSPELAEPIARLVRDARALESRILAIVGHDESIGHEVETEVKGFAEAIDRTARRAQLLHEAIEDSSPDRIVVRLAELGDDPSHLALRNALQTQLASRRSMEQQLEHFCTELERMLVELDIVRSHLVSMAASAESAVQQQAAAELRDLREQLGTVADGMRAAYEPRAA